MTTSEIAVHQGSALAISGTQDFWNDKQLAALRQIGVQDASNGDLAVFFHHAQRTGLDPFARQIYMIKRQGKQTIQTGIDGFRLVARRAVDRAGEELSYEDTLWSDADGNWHDVWLSDTPPAAAKVVVLRAGKRHPEPQRRVTAAVIKGEAVPEGVDPVTGEVQPEPTSDWPETPEPGTVQP